MSSIGDSTKRLRIDPNALNQPITATMLTKKKDSTSAVTAQKKTSISPTAAALKQIDEFTESLYPQLQNLLPIISKKHLKLLQLRHNKQTAVDRFKNTITIAEQNDAAQIPSYPKSANFKFSLRPPKKLETNPEFVALQTEADSYMKAVKLQLTKYIKEAAELEAKTLTLEINQSLSDAMIGITTGILQATQYTDYDKDKLVSEAHKIVNSILELDSETILKHSNKTKLEDFRSSYKTLYRLDTLPEPETFQVALSPARRRNTARVEMIGDSIGHAIMAEQEPPLPPAPRTQRTKSQTQILNIKNAIESLLLRPFDIFLNHSTENNRQAALKKLETELLGTKATEATAMELDSETAPSPAQLGELITKQVAKATAPLQKEINRLQRELTGTQPNNQKTSSKNNRRGRSNSQPRNKPNRRGASNSKRNTNSTRKNTNSTNTTSRPNRGRSPQNSRRPQPGRGGRAGGPNKGLNNASSRNNRSTSRRRSSRSSSRPRTNSGRQNNQSSRN